MREHYTETGIAKEEFKPALKTFLENPLVMMDVKIKKLNGPTQDRSNWENADVITMLELYNRAMLEALADPEFNALDPDIAYFSGHPGPEVVEQWSEIGAYWRFFLDPGEEADFQVGWFVEGPLDGRETTVVTMEDTEGLVLFVDNGSGRISTSNRNCVDLSTDAS